MSDYVPVLPRLIAFRQRRGISQAEMARRLKCTQSCVSKLEHAKEKDVRVGDLYRYARALGLKMRIIFPGLRHRKHSHDAC